MCVKLDDNKDNNDWAKKIRESHELGKIQKELEYCDCWNRCPSCGKPYRPLSTCWVAQIGGKHCR